MRHTRVPLAIATVILLAACDSEGPTTSPTSIGTSTNATAVAATGDPLHVVATWKLPPGNALVATPRWLWVLGGPSGALTQIDPATNTVVRELRPPHPPGFGTYADGTLWIASFLDDAVMQLDADSGRVLRTIESSHRKPFYRPVGVAVTGDDLWVLNHGDEKVRASLTRLDAGTGEVLGTTRLPGHFAGGPALVADRLWIGLTEQGTVVRVDPRTGRLDGSPIVVDTGICLSGSVAGGDLWYTGLDDPAGGSCRTVARRLDADSAELSPLAYGPGRSLFNFASAGGSLWASDVGHTIYQVDVDSAELRPSLTLPGPDASNRLVSAFGSLWVFGGETGRLVRIDAS